MLARINSLLVVLAIAALVLATAGSAQAVSGLAGYWNLNDTGSSVADSSGNGNHGSLATSEGGTTPLVGQPGMIGNAILFYGGSNGQGSGVLIPISNTTPYEAMTATTYSTWYNFTDSWPADSQPRFFQGDGNFPIIGTDQPEGNPYRAYAYLAQAGSDQSFDTPAMPTSTGWHQLTVTYLSGTGCQMYFDGVPQGDMQYADGELPTLTGLALSGYYVDSSTIGAGNSVLGYMDDVGIFNKALTATQAKAIFSVPKTFQNSGLNTAGTGNYGLGDMDTLFETFDQGPGHTCTIGGRTWQYATDLPGGPDSAGLAGQLPNGAYYVVLGDNGGIGMETVGVPEPGTLALLAAGLAGLLCYAWRKRR